MSMTIRGKYNLAQMNLGNMTEQCVQDSNRWFPGKAQSLPNLVLCLAGEVGEVANLVKKIVRGDLTIGEAVNEDFMLAEGKDPLPWEIVDVLIYLCNLMGAKEFEHINWKRIWDEKRRFNEDRFGGASTPAPDATVAGYISHDVRHPADALEEQ